MKISNRGIELIKSFEGLRLKAYKALPSEKYYTIGYGHYGEDVKRNMTITEEQATEYLKNDLATAERAVDRLKRNFNQNQFDALVSFTYNCGQGNLKKLCSPDRSLKVIGQKLVLYNKANGEVIKGLVRRREAEQKLYFS